ncbi:hypothetical protein THIX_70094 [Thiomonas sp. X19]|nr:hypothetical protein THIX_70094 [Thiomonas sp. X19]
MSVPEGGHQRGRSSAAQPIQCDFSVHATYSVAHAAHNVLNFRRTLCDTATSISNPTVQPQALSPSTPSCSFGSCVSCCRWAACTVC